jgi:ABC-type spermidine/putrescine transport system permease subunit II
MRLVFVVLWLGLTAAPLLWLVWRGDVSAARAQAWARAAVWRAPLVTALAQAALSAALALLLAWPAALGFAEWRFVGRRLGRRMLWLARLCPGALLAVPLVALALRAPILPEFVQVALAHLVFNVPAATWILFVALERVPRTLVHEARQDGLDLFAKVALVWWPVWRAPSVLAFLVCFAASAGEAALTRALGAQDSLAVTVPAIGSALADRALSAAALCVPALLWASVLAWWWVHRRLRDEH